MQPEDGRRRVVIDRVTPEIDGGRFPVKRVIGEEVVVEADCFADGHDLLACLLRHRAPGAAAWEEVPMEPLGEDRFRACFVVHALGRHLYAVEGFVDRFGTWRRNLGAKLAAGQDVSADLASGAELVRSGAARAGGRDAQLLEAWGHRLAGEDGAGAALAEDLAALMALHPDRTFSTACPKVLEIAVDRELAASGAWYEMFPRSAWADEPAPANLAACEDRLPQIAGMGFDVLYLPPIHPIGRTNRKGKNNTPQGGAGSPGSPWAIGSAEGGHTAVDPALGSMGDFERFLKRAKDHGLEVALDLTFQASPDHPYVAAHPEWFRRRPDGSIQFAENPPKKYEDVYPFEFEGPAWRELWEELLGVVEFWVGRGIRIFRVDNPHGKPLGFWEWLIGSVKRAHPDVIFLSEAFTGPRVMYRLSKLGFTQSYTYFAWRNTKEELTSYFEELADPSVAEHFRPSLWPNTPDILTEVLQKGGRQMFMARLVLAATLGACYGIYGPAFELCEHLPQSPGSEEYLDSEKYEIRRWDVNREDSLRELIATLNRIRREQPALRADRGLAFHEIGNDQLIAYTKPARGSGPAVLVVVNLDPARTQAGVLSLRREDLGLEAGATLEVKDLISGRRLRWRGERHRIELKAGGMPARILSVGPAGPAGEARV